MLRLILLGNDIIEREMPMHQKVVARKLNKLADSLVVISSLYSVLQFMNLIITINVPLTAKSRQNRSYHYFRILCFYRYCHIFFVEVHFCLHVIFLSCLGCSVVVVY